MSLYPAALYACLTCSLVALDFTTACAGGQAPQFEIDLKELDKLKSSPMQAPSKKRGETSSKPLSRSKAPTPAAAGTTTYTVKPGDFLFKILMRDFGMSNREAELRIDDVMRANNLASSTRLTVGQKLVIPAQGQTAPDRHTRPPEGRHAPRRPESAQKPAPAEPDQPATVPDTTSTASAPVVAASTEPALPVAAIPEPVTTDTLRLSLHSVTGADLEQNLDLLLTALSVPWIKDRVIEEKAGSSSPESFSIKVDRYLELNGKRYVLTANRKDLYEYTILRLLEMAGYTVMRLDEKSSISEITAQILTQFNFAFSSGKHLFTLPDRVDEPRIIDGFLVTLTSPPSRIFITETPLDAVSAEILGSSSVDPYAEEPVVAPEK